MYSYYAHIPSFILINEPTIYSKSFFTPSHLIRYGLCPLLNLISICLYNNTLNNLRASNGTGSGRGIYITYSNNTIINDAIVNNYAVGATISDNNNISNGIFNNNSDGASNGVGMEIFGSNNICKNIITGKIEIETV